MCICIKKKKISHHTNSPDLETSHGGPYLLCVPHRYNIRLKHLRDEDEPVCQLGGRLVEVGWRHGVWRVRRLVSGVLAHEAGHLHG